MGYECCRTHPVVFYRWGVGEKRKEWREVPVAQMAGVPEMWKRGSDLRSPKCIPGSDRARVLFRRKGTGQALISKALKPWSTKGPCIAPLVPPFIQFGEGVPRMNVAERTEELGSPHRWTTFDAGAPEWQENFLDYASPLLPNDFIGQLVLDAGCGYGRHAFFAGRYGAEVVAFDRSSDAIAAAAANTAGLQRVHLVQGDIEHPPFREEMFDLTYCFGDASFADRGKPFVSSGVVCGRGRLSLWVYGPRKGAALHVANALRGLTSGLGPQQLHNLSRVIAGGLQAFDRTPYRMMGALPVAKAVVSRLPVHDHHQWPYDVVVADIYDRLRIPVTKWFPRELT